MAIKPIKDVVNPGKTFMLNTLDRLVKKVLIHTNKGKDAYGLSMKKYKGDYAERKKKIYPGWNGKINLKLRGHLHSAFQVQQDTVNKQTGQVGWADAENAIKASSNKKRGRSMYKGFSKDFPFSKNIENWFRNELIKQFGKNIKLLNSRTVINVGKK